MPPHLAAFFPRGSVEQHLTLALPRASPPTLGGGKTFDFLLIRRQKCEIRW